MKEFFVGQTATISKVFTQDEVIAFSELSLDKNPAHLDEDFAKDTIFGRRIVHGFLSGSLISAIIGTQLPGNGTIYLHQDMDFRKPVYVGELLTAQVKVVGIKPEKSILYLETKCFNSQGDVAIEGSAVVKV